MINFLPNISPTMEWVVLLGAVVTALVVLHKSIVKPFVVLCRKINSGMDTLLGYPAVIDPGSGKELKSPTPPLAERVETLEEAMRVLIDTQERLLSVHERLAELEDWRKGHEQWSEQMIRDLQIQSHEWQKEHEAMHLLASEVGKKVGEP